MVHIYNTNIIHIKNTSIGLQPVECKYRRFSLIQTSWDWIQLRSVICSKVHFVICTKLKCPCVSMLISALECSAVCSTQTASTQLGCFHKALVCRSLHCSLYCSTNSLGSYQDHMHSLRCWPRIYNSTHVLN